MVDATSADCLHLSFAGVCSSGSAEICNHQQPWRLQSQLLRHSCVQSCSTSARILHPAFVQVVASILFKNNPCLCAFFYIWEEENCVRH